MRSRHHRIAPDQAKRSHQHAHARVRDPRRVVVGDYEAWLWDVWIDGLHHELAWWPSNGEIRWSYPVSDSDRSSFVRLGPRYSPRYDLIGAIESVQQWADNEQQRAAS